MLLIFSSLLGSLNITSNKYCNKNHKLKLASQKSIAKMKRKASTGAEQGNKQYYTLSFWCD